MSDNGETVTIDVSTEGINACKRIEASMAALDRAIASVEKSAKPEDKAKVKAAEALKPPEPTAAHQKNKDHEDNFFKNIAQAALFKKLSGEDAHGFIDEEYDKKYSAPLEKKLKYAKALGISEVHDTDGKPIQMNELAKNTRQDIDLAKATASLIVEGHTKLKIPKYESVAADVKRGAQFVDAIIECANKVRKGETPDYAVKPDTEKYANLVTPSLVPRVSGHVAWNKNSKMNFNQMMGMEPEPVDNVADDLVDENKLEITPRQAAKRGVKLLGTLNPAVIPNMPLPGMAPTL